MVKKLKIAITSLVVIVLLIAGGCIAGTIIGNNYKNEPMATVKIQSGVCDPNHTDGFIREFEPLTTVFGRGDLVGTERTHTIEDHLMDANDYIKIVYTIQNESTERLSLNFNASLVEQDNYRLTYLTDSVENTIENEQEYENPFSVDIEANETRTVYLYIRLISPGETGSYNGEISLFITNAVRDV